jgi:AcrR family transcriptional regulator
VREQTTTRRRGRELEDAILGAVLEELAETGYVNLTVEGVAARARTSRPVLHRRWPTRAELVLAALRQNHPRSDELTDTGAFRSDVIALLQQIRQRFAAIGPEVIWGLLAETARDPRASAVLRSQFTETLTQREELLTTLLDRAIARGEFGPDRPTARVIALPLDLIRHDILVYGEADEDDIISIVDEVLIPLLRESQA